MTTTAKQLPVWDLSDLFSGVDDPAIDQALNQLLSNAEEFERAHKDTLLNPEFEANQFKRALDEYEAISRMGHKLMSYAQLMFAANTQDPAIGALLQKVRERVSAVNIHLVFFELEIGRMPREALDAMGQAPPLSRYRYYLEKVKKQSWHHLSEAEEKLLTETANSRGAAFKRLSTEIDAKTTYALERDGEIEQLQLSDALALLRDEHRDVRKSAAKSLTQGLKQNAHTGTFILNTLMHEKDVLDRLKKFKSPEAERHLNNDVAQGAVDAMVGVCADNFDLVAEYYALKKDLLGLDALTHYDRYAPLASAKEQVTFSRARSMVMDAFESFNVGIAKQVESFFTQGWIDAEVTPGKSGGAFCAGVTPDLHPYVFMNFTNTLDDVMTLAHELGHGIHGVLAARNHMLDYQPALPLAETASTFAEMLTFDQLLANMVSDGDRLALSCSKLENIFATVFRQIGIFNFERAIHDLRRTKGEQTTEAINEVWQRTQQEMFGHSLTLGEDHAWWWLYIPHIVQVPFYVYAYAFGELLALSLYQRYQAEGEAFVEGYLALLSAGGSASPATLTEALGVDIEDAAFWQGGCDLIRQRVQQAKALMASG